jgi:hypothetical protein
MTAQLKLPEPPDKYDALWMRRYSQVLVSFFGGLIPQSNPGRANLVTATVGVSPWTYTNKGGTLLNVFLKDPSSGSATYTTGSTTFPWFVNTAVVSYYALVLGRGDSFTYTYTGTPVVQIVPI